MPDSPELLALALELESESVAEESAIATLVEAAGCSPTTLMGAYAYALSLAHDQPYDLSNEHMLGLLTKALQRAVRLSGEQRTHDGAGLFQQIVDVSGRRSVTASAVAARTAEVEADVAHLRPIEDPSAPAE
jgi:hypothetical protein